MEGCIEHAYLRQTGHKLADGLNTLEVGRIVQRSQVDALFKSLEHLVGKHHALVELLASVHHTVANGVDFIEVFNNADFRIGEQ